MKKAEEGITLRSSGRNKITDLTREINEGKRPDMLTQDYRGYGFIYTSGVTGTPNNQFTLLNIDKQVK